MSFNGKKILHCTDEWGGISVYQDENLRYLCFEGDIEQSCIDMSAPGQLCHKYTQVMMLGFMLAKRPTECTLLGLGAGSLAQAILNHQPHCQLHAVEQRAKVVDIAFEWFALPRSKKLRVHIGDAFEYLARNPAASDIIFTDLYLSDGMNEIQAQEEFLAACRAALKPSGLLVCNYWSGNNLTAYALNQSLLEVFGQQVLRLSVPDGNCVTFAFDTGIPDLNARQFIQQAAAVGDAMHIPLQRHARALMRENRQRFIQAKYT